MSLENEFKEKLPKYTKLKNEVQFIINDELENKNIKIHSLTSRIKTFDSLNNKANRKDISNPFKEINDIVGIRVVVLLRSDLEKVENLITNNFDIISKDNKIDDMDTSSFGYMSNHFIVKLKDVYNGPRYNFIKDLVCEIQIRTIAMDAWATISHYLDYKTEHDVPKELKKDFYALSGLFYVADTHFELFYKERDESKQNAEKDIIENKDIEINLDTLSAYLQDKFPDKGASPSEYISELLDELYEYKYTFISKLDHDINLSYQAFLKYELEHPPHNEKGQKFHDVGIIRSIMKILNTSEMPYADFSHYIKRNV